MFKLLRIFPALACITLCACATETQPPKEYKAGANESVKDWKPRPFETLKGLSQPIAVYIYDAGVKRNIIGFNLEGKEGFGTPEVKEKFAKFLKIKIKDDGTDAKGWPEAIRKQANNGAALILMSGDMSVVHTFDKTKEAPERSPQAILAAVKSIMVHQEKLKAADKAKEKEADAKAAKFAAEVQAKEKEQEALKLTSDRKKKPEQKKPADSKTKLPDDE